MSKGIQAEIKQSKPFASLEEETAIALARTSDQLERRVTELLKKHDLTATQYNVLRILRGAGEEGHACSAIGERMVTRDPDITRLLDRMERAGLCVRNRDAHDRRVIVTRVTPKGLDVLRRLDTPVRELNLKLLGHMGEARLKTLLRLLQDVRQTG
ncbi:MAG TPA: MarR family transcriptional regulator [Terriglobales bacterium]|jgi:DNA-binding MarR family transcriptional regulator